MTEDISRLQFNTALAALMEFTNAAHKTGTDKESARMMCRVAAPLAPHLAEEIWERLGEEYSIFDSGWPEFDPSLIVEKTVTIAIQVNGKLRGQMEIEAGADKDSVLAAAKKVDNAAKYLQGLNIAKEIYVPDKLVNFVVK